MIVSRNRNRRHNYTGSSVPCDGKSARARTPSHGETGHLPAVEQRRGRLLSSGSVARNAPCQEKKKTLARHGTTAAAVYGAAEMKRHAPPILEGGGGHGRQDGIMLRLARCCGSADARFFGLAWPTSFCGSHHGLCTEQSAALREKRKYA